MSQKGMSGRSGYSSQSCSPSPSRGHASVPKPPNTKVEPQDDKNKMKEKEEMVGLNDRFVAYIDKVRRLEQQKKVLETRRDLLLGQGDYKAKPEDIVKEIAADLKRRIDELARDRKKLQDELAKSQDRVDDTRARLEDEMKKKTDLENDFIISKKDLDQSYLQKVMLELELEDLHVEIGFLKRGFDEEIKELESQIHNDTVIVKTDNTPNLDMDKILQEVKTQYEDMAARGRAEAEQWNNRNTHDILLKSEKQENDVKDIKKEIQELQRILQKLQSEMDSLTKKKKSIEDEISRAENDGKDTLKAIRDQITKLEEALHRDRKLLAERTRDYQELLNLKLALDIEIAAYNQILEGEEMRMADFHPAQPDF